MKEEEEEEEEEERGKEIKGCKNIFNTYDNVTFISVNYMYLSSNKNSIKEKEVSKKGTR